MVEHLEEHGYDERRAERHKDEAGEPAEERIDDALGFACENRLVDEQGEEVDARAADHEDGARRKRRDDDTDDEDENGRAEAEELFKAEVALEVGDEVKHDARADEDGAEAERRKGGGIEFDARCSVGFGVEGEDEELDGRECAERLDGGLGNAGVVGALHRLDELDDADDEEHKQGDDAGERQDRGEQEAEHGGNAVLAVFEPFDDGLPNDGLEEVGRHQEVLFAEKRNTHGRAAAEEEAEEENDRKERYDRAYGIQDLLEACGGGFGSRNGSGLPGGLHGSRRFEGLAAVGAELRAVIVLRTAIFAIHSYISPYNFFIVSALTGYVILSIIPPPSYLSSIFAKKTDKLVKFVGLTRGSLERNPVKIPAFPKNCSKLSLVYFISEKMKKVFCVFLAKRLLFFQKHVKIFHGNIFMEENNETRPH